MSDIKIAINEDLMESGKLVLVFGADAEKLNAEIEGLIRWEKPVILFDFRFLNVSPTWEQLQARLEQLAVEQGIAHFAISGNLEPSFMDGLSTLVEQNRSTGFPIQWDERDRYFLPIVVSFTSEGLSELDPELKWRFLREGSTFVGSAEHNSRFKSLRHACGPRYRQAVVFFHGIGEQFPSESIKRFAEGVLPDPGYEFSKYKEYPDKQSYQHRVLRSTSVSVSQDEDGTIAGGVIKSPRNTDFFEYYWADRPSGMKLSDSLLWLAGLLFRRPPRQILPLWGLSWTLLILAIFGAYAGWLYSVRGPAATPWGFIVTIASASVSFAFSYFLVRYLGDAVLYFSPKSERFRARESILEEGVKLLQRLSVSGDYDRIVVVGHSLGSVIAYDVLHALWESEFWNLYPSPRTWEYRPALNAFEEAASHLEESPNDYTLRDYQEKQLALWHEMVAMGNPWRVTDLITLGSPLTHASFLLRGNFEEKRVHGDLPGTPPARIPMMGGIVQYTVLVEGIDRLSQNDGFMAMTRWTNLYFPALLGLFGDFVGGPLQKLFGPGVRDVAVATSNPFKRFTPLAHLSYWSGNLKSEFPHDVSNTLQELVRALDLNGENLGIPRGESR